MPPESSSNENLNEAVSAATRALAQDPELEISLLKETIKLINDDKQNKMLITNYQFISAIIDQPIFSPARTYTANNISYPTKGSKFFESYNPFKGCSPILETIPLVS